MVLNWLWIDGDVDAGITGPCLNWTLGEMPPCFEFYFKGHQLQVRQSKTRQQHCCCWWTTLELTRWYPCSLPCGAGIIGQIAQREKSEQCTGCWMESSDFCCWLWLLSELLGVILPLIFNIFQFYLVLCLLMFWICI